jgi:hypothetical protein
MKTVLVTLLALMLPLAVFADDFTTRTGGPNESEMLVRSMAGQPDGMAFFRPVLTGVLYRGGFQGGDKGRTGLSETQKQSLCQSGFSEAFYADFGKNTSYGTTSCGAGSFEYKSARSSRPASVMQDVHKAIVNDSGPVLVHCMWGVHSSGALSAMALVQFCGWSEDRAKAYWNEARNGAPCSGGCDSWIDGKFAKFSVDPSLAISDAQRAAICPK